MIPFFTPPSLHLGPVTVEAFGLFVALGVWLGSAVALREARREGLSPAPLQDFVPWALGAGIVVGHLVHLCLYHPEELQRGPWQLFRVWDGLSSTGGLLGGVVATALYFRRRHVTFRVYGDALAVAVSLGWAVARVGCFLVHDHPGIRTAFPLAVAFPDGARHDLGLDDALLLFTLHGLLLWMRRTNRLPGKLLGVLALAYGLGRFGLDFLRARDLDYVDRRYLGLTPAQYACAALVLYGVSILVRRGDAPAAMTSPAALS